MHYQAGFDTGTVTELGQISVTAEQIIAFATEFDPQPYHIDPIAAAQSPFGGIIASGWHIGSMFMGLLARRMLQNAGSIVGSGLDRMDVHTPVRPGDTLNGLVTISDNRPGQGRARRGAVALDGELHNQRGELVLTVRILGRMLQPAP